MVTVILDSPLFTPCIQTCTEALNLHLDTFMTSTLEILDTSFVRKANGGPLIPIGYWVQGLQDFSCLSNLALYPNLFITLLQTQQTQQRDSG